MTARPENPPAVSDEELSAYIDGELSSVRSADITALSQYDGSVAERIAGFRADKARLTEFYGPLIARPVPAAWMHTIEQARRQNIRQPSPRRLFAIAASLALMVMGFATFALYRTTAEDTAIADALTARHDSLVMTATAKATISAEAADRTVQTVLGPGVKAPDLSKLGYRLAAAHTMADGKAVTIDYADAQNRMFTVYLRHSPGATRFDMVKRGPTRICIWQDDVLSAVMLGDMSAGEMLRLATLAYAGLSAV